MMSEAKEKFRALWNARPDPEFLADPRRGSPHSRGAAVTGLVKTRTLRVVTPEGGHELAATPKTDAAAMPDLNVREWAMLAPIAAAVLWMGVYPVLWPGSLLTIHRCLPREVFSVSWTSRKVTAKSSPSLRRMR